MKGASPGLNAALALAIGVAGATMPGGALPGSWGAAFAQATVLEKLRACTLLAQSERSECFERISRETDAASAPAAAAGANWVVSETVSPLDYSPVATATAWTVAQPGGQALQLAIACRGGRAELVLSGPALSGTQPEDLTFSLAVDGGATLLAATGVVPSGRGVALRTDAARLLSQLPDSGDLVIRGVVRRGAAFEARYVLPAMKAAAARLSAPCRWQAGNPATPADQQQRRRP